MEGIRLVGFFRCACGKIHCYGGLSPNSRCTCGMKLYLYAISVVRRNQIIANREQKLAGATNNLVITGQSIESLPSNNLHARARSLSYWSRLTS